MLIATVYIPPYIRDFRGYLGLPRCLRPAFPGVKNTQPRRVGCFRFKKETEGWPENAFIPAQYICLFSRSRRKYNRLLAVRETLDAAIPYDKLQCYVEMVSYPPANMPADSHITTPDLGDIPFREWLRLSSVTYRVEESIRSANTAALSIAQDKTAASRNSSNHGLDVRLQRALHKTANVPRPRIGHPYYDSCKSIDSFHTLFTL